MKTESGLYYGSVSCEVGDLLFRQFQALPTFVSAIVRCIDSTRAPLDIASILLRYGVEARLDATTVLLSPEQLYQAATRRAFVSYDEVWLIEGDRPKREVSLRHNLLPAFGDSQIVPASLETYMREIGCVLAIAAGSDLSYATWDGVFAMILETEFNTLGKKPK